MRQVAVSGQVWSYTVTPGKGVPIIFLHGWGRSGSEWVPFAQRLHIATGRPVYTVDLPGFGGSPIPIVSDITEYTERFFQWLTYMKLKEISLVGHSLGGRVGIVLAATRPEVFEALVLVDPAGVKPRSIRQTFLRTAAALFRWVPPSIRARVVGGIMDEDYRSSPELRTLYRAIVKTELTPYLSRILCPTYVIWGEKDPLLPLGQTDVYKRLIPDVRIRVVWGAGHDPQLSHAEKLMRILEEIWTF